MIKDVFQKLFGGAKYLSAALVPESSKNLPTWLYLAADTENPPFILFPDGSIHRAAFLKECNLVFRGMMVKGVVM